MISTDKRVRIIFEYQLRPIFNDWQENFNSDDEDPELYEIVQDDAQALLSEIQDWLDENPNETNETDEAEDTSGFQYRQPKSHISGKEGAKDIPSWAKGERPLLGESGSEFAHRLLTDKYGEANYSTETGAEFNKLKKYGDRNFD